MRIVFVRHGHPNYADDCLTERGHEHAEAAALRLMDEGIGEIFSSSCGRAYETAQHTAEKLGLPIEQIDFIREIHWGSREGEELSHNGNPWLVAQDAILDGEPLMCKNWHDAKSFSRNTILHDAVDAVAEGVDQWLERLGYTREGDYYRVTGENTDRTVALFSHAGASSAALAHMFNLPFSYICAAISPFFTAITIVTLSDQPGDLTMPTFEICNDSRPAQRMENVISN